MDCNKLNTWFDTASKDELFNPTPDFKEHLGNCQSCSQEFELLTAAYKTIDIQKKSGLSDIQFNNLIDRLENLETGKLFWAPFFNLSRLATAAVIVLGLLSGTLAGILMSKDNPNETSNTWENEFSMLSKTDDYTPSIFD